jgi:FkbM family methyltransferase
LYDLKISALITAAYVEVRRATGIKPNVRVHLNRFFHRPHEQDFEVLRWFKPPPASVYVDVGANRGETIESVRMYHADIEIVAFEPNPELVELVTSHRLQDSRFRLIAVGLGKSAGRFDLYIPYYKGVPLDGLASFTYSEAAEWLSSQRLFAFDGSYQELRTISCCIERLDTFALAPSFIKIDVQGLEADVVSGGITTITHFRPIVLMENNMPERDAKQLIELGYEAYAYEGKKLVAKSYGVLNTFYIHPATRSLLAAEAYA